MINKVFNNFLNESTYKVFNILLLLFIYKLGHSISLPFVAVHHDNSVENDVNSLFINNDISLFFASINDLSIMSLAPVGFIIALIKMFDVKDKIKNKTLYVDFMVPVTYAAVLVYLFAQNYIIQQFIKKIYVLMILFLILIITFYIYNYIVYRLSKKANMNIDSLWIFLAILEISTRIFHSSNISVTTSGIVIFSVWMYLVFFVYTGLVLVHRKITINIAKNLESTGRRIYASRRIYLKMPVLFSGIVPLAGSLAIITLLDIVLHYLFGINRFDINGLAYNVSIFIITFFYSIVIGALIIDPQRISQFLIHKKGFIPGIKPGDHTVNFIDYIASRLILFQAFFLSFVSILPALISYVTGINDGFQFFLGGFPILALIYNFFDIFGYIPKWNLEQAMIE